MEHDRLLCPVCRKGRLVLKYEAKYVYSYKIDANAPGSKNTDEFLSYLYDNREQAESGQFIECENCGARHPCVFSPETDRIDRNVLEEAINGLILKIYK